MSLWWTGISSRERMLIFVAGALAAFLIVSLLIIRPVITWNEEANSKAERARDGYELTATAAAVSGSSSPAATNSAAPLRQAVISTADQAGIDLVRIGSVTESQIEIQAAPANAEAMFAWFAELESRYGISVTFADMTRGEAGLINAQVLVFERRI
ncbi:type II secretion system protein M [Hyphococcus flavus]|uniref:Type II secretion system protein M n=1 Tax=Hyphococcus flavus TaxID=1866326 RepID=A0AAF0CGX8_9PROT|nr:type II secretion system protein M [Hyphococcus flavus]WDI31242.1 type II secretion system protein M [Hyphococcus flavus]